MKTKLEILAGYAVAVILGLIISVGLVTYGVYVTASSPQIETEMFSTSYLP